MVAVLNNSDTHSVSTLLGTAVQSNQYDRSATNLLYDACDVVEV